MTINEILVTIEKLTDAERRELWTELLAGFPDVGSLLVVEQSPSSESLPGIYEVTFDDLPLPDDWPPEDYAENIDYYLYGTPKRNISETDNGCPSPLSMTG